MYRKRFDNSDTFLWNGLCEDTFNGYVQWRMGCLREPDSLRPGRDEHREGTISNYLCNIFMFTAEGQRNI